MSWDVLFVKYDRTYQNPKSIPKDAVSVGMGRRAQIHAAINAVFSGTDWHDPTWGIWQSDADLIEFNLEDKEEVRSFMLHVQASDAIVDDIIKLAKQNGWQALDTNSSSFLEQKDDPAEGLRNWRVYRDKVIASYQN